MRIFEKSYDPFTGMTTTYGAEDDKLVIKTDGDVSAALDYATKLRNAPEYSANGIKKNFWHAVHIPDIVAMKMRTEDGFDVYAANAKEIRQFLVRNRDKYGNLFTTGGKV